jgi:hypothetical protein
MTAWWPRSLTSQIASRTDRDSIEAGIKQLSVPCDPAWLMARVLALLTPYFTPNIPEGVRRIEAEDWRASLEGKPAWAIEKACRWWKSDENPDHRRKPLEGDIADRVKFEMGILSFGAMKVREYDAGYTKRMAEPEPERPTPEQMEQRRAFAKTVLRRNGLDTGFDRPTGPRREGIEPGEVEAMRAHLAAKGMA